MTDELECCTTHCVPFAIEYEIGGKSFVLHVCNRDAAKMREIQKIAKELVND